MATLSIDLPVPGTLGPGATINVSALGADRTIQVTGTGFRAIGIEGSNDGVNFVTLATFQRPGQCRVLRVAVAFMRAVVQSIVSPFQPVVANADVSGEDSGTIVAVLVVPGAGVGAAVDVTALGPIKSAIVVPSVPLPANAFGSVVLEGSGDGIDFVPKMSFGGPGGLQTREFITSFMRARRIGGSIAASLVCQIGGATPPGGGGISAITVQDEGIVVGSRSTINFIGASVSAVDNPGDDRVDITVVGEFILQSVNVSTVLASANRHVRVSPPALGLTITMPTVVGIGGQEIIIANITQTSNPITIIGAGAETIGSQASRILTEAGATLRFVADGVSNWDVV